MDTGSMAAPRPMPAGNLGTTAPMGADVGSMSAPTGGTTSGLQTNVPLNDTGSMATPRGASGNAPTRSITP